MPYTIRKIRGKPLYKVMNSKTKEIHSQGSTLEKAKAQVRLLENLPENTGEGLPLIAFTSKDEEPTILLPMLNDIVLEVPKYFIYQVYPKKLKQNERRFKLFIPTTNTNKLSSRLKKSSIEVKAIDNDEIKLHEHKDNVIQIPPKLSEFSKQDQNKLKDYFLNVENNIQKQLKEPEVRQQKPKGRKIKYATVDEAKEIQAQQKRDASKKTYQNLKEQRLILKEKKRQEKEAQKILKQQEKESQKLLKKQQKQQGTGIIKSISKVGNKIINKISKVGKQTGKFIEKVLNPDEWMPLDVKELMKNKGDEIITSITLRRNPVSHLITGAMNAVSLGAFQKKLNKQPYDELFHLAMLVTTSNTKFLLEKIERVNISYNVTRPEGLEELSVPLNGKEITVFDLINNTKEAMGKTNFLDYDAVTNNCQVFIMNVLNANELLNESNKQWVKQDTEVLFKGNKTLAKISKKLTDIGASANVLLHGGKLINKNYEKNNISSNTIMNDLSYSLPQKQMQHEQQLYTALQNSSLLPEPLQAGAGLIKTINKIKRVGNRIGNKINQGINTAENINNKVDEAIKKIKNIPEEAKPHLKDIGLDLAEILVKRGIPVTVGTLAGMLVTTATGNPALGIASSVSAGYASQMLANKLAKEENISGSSGNGLYGGAGPYAQGHGSGFDSSDSEDECCKMCGGKLLIDRKFSVRDVYNTAKSIPKQVNKNLKSLKEGKPEEDMSGGMMKPPATPKVINNGVRMNARGVKGSQEAKDYMKKLRDMRRKK
jgi:hypothetical protein